MVHTEEHIDTMEKRDTGATLMTCRYCIRYEMGMCLKDNPTQAREPLFLRGADGRRYRLHFDCRRCEMSLTASE